METVSLDNTVSSSPTKYQISLQLTGSASLATNLGGLRKTTANPDVYITRISVVMGHAAAGLGNPISLYRAINVSGGVQIAAADLPKLNTSYGDATLEVRTGAVAGAKANQRLDILGGHQVVTASTSGPQYLWEPNDISDYIRLTVDEGLIFDQSPIAGDADDRYFVTITWEEV